MSCHTRDLSHLRPIRSTAYQISASGLSGVINNNNRQTDRQTDRLTDTEIDRRCDLNSIYYVTLTVSVLYICYVSLKPRREAHLLNVKCLQTYCLHLKLLAHKPQAKLLVSECTSRCCFKSYDVQKRFGHSLQTYGFTPSCRRTCNLKSPLRTKFF